MRKTIALATTLAALVLGGWTWDAKADPSPPTNGGNGAGQSGQCTGPAADRPTSCKSP